MILKASRHRGGRTWLSICSGPKTNMSKCVRSGASARERRLEPLKALERQWNQTSAVSMAAIFSKLEQIVDEAANYGAHGVSVSNPTA